MTLVLIAAGWLICSLITMRILLRVWWNDFGDYEGGVVLAILIGFLGPLGVGVATLVWLLSRDWPPHDPDRSTRVLDLIRGSVRDES